MENAPATSQGAPEPNNQLHQEDTHFSSAPRRICSMAEWAAEHGWPTAAEIEAHQARKAERDEEINFALWEAETARAQGNVTDAEYTGWVCEIGREFDLPITTPEELAVMAAPATDQESANLAWAEEYTQMTPTERAITARVLGDTLTEEQHRLLAEHDAGSVFDPGVPLPSVPDVNGGERIDFVKASTLRTRAAEWAWEYDGGGRIPRTALTLFAGRPAAGKSTTARWFAAGWTRGTLDGCFLGHPINVLYVATEEALEEVVAPSLIAAGADMDRIVVATEKNTPARLKSVEHEEIITQRCVDNNVRAIVLDPLMSTIGGRSDVNRTNEMRDRLDPWVRISEAINGPILGICHLVKTPGGDVLAAINGSSAFGEVARAAFGFAVDRDGDDDARIMSQVKNSFGRDGLNLAYRIGVRDMVLDDGETSQVPRFELVGPTDRAVRDILVEERSTRTESGVERCQKWLKGYLTLHGESTSTDVFAAGAEFGFSLRMIQRSAPKLDVAVQRTRGVPSRTLWSLPAAPETGATA